MKRIKKLERKTKANIAVNVVVKPVVLGKLKEDAARMLVAEFNRDDRFGKA